SPRLPLLLLARRRALGPGPHPRRRPSSILARLRPYLAAHEEPVRRCRVASGHAPAASDQPVEPSSEGGSPQASASTKTPSRHWSRARPSAVQAPPSPVPQASPGAAIDGSQKEAPPSLLQPRGPRQSAAKASAPSRQRRSRSSAVQAAEPFE